MDFFEISNLSRETGKKKSIIKNYSANRSVGNFFDTLGSTGKRLGLLINKRKFLFLIIFIFFVLFIMLLRLFYLQINKGNHYRSIADGNRIRVERIQPKRGIIYGGNVLVSPNDGFLESLLNELTDYYKEEHKPIMASRYFHEYSLLSSALLKISISLLKSAIRAFLPSTKNSATPPDLVNTTGIPLPIASN